MKKRRAIALLVSLLLIVVVVLSGCGSNYLKADAVKRGISFSFEYPPEYTKLTPDAFEDNVAGYSVSLLYTEPGSTQEKADIQIYINPSPPIAGRPDALGWSEEHLKVLEEADAGFRLYEQSSVQVAGINGYKLVYYSTILGNYLDSSNLICRDVYIDYKEYIWKIAVLAVDEIDEQAEQVFQHVIETFKFTD